MRKGIAKVEKKEEIGFTSKQMEFLQADSNRINFLSGSVRSGKTYVSLVKWALWVASQPEDMEFIMVGKTITSLKRNCLSLLEKFVGTDNFHYSSSNKFGTLFGRRVYLEGANDERSENKIRGMTLFGAYCDEVTLYPESFFSMLLTRLSFDDARLWATCNPDNPSHYIKMKYIDNEELDMKVWNFILTDNTYLGAKFIENISKEFTGVFYNRFILGQWVRAEGIIYREFADQVDSYLIDEIPKDLIQVTIGVDFGGNASATTFVCSGITQNYRDVVILENKYIKEELTPIKLENLFVEFVKICISKYGRVNYIYVDSAEQILKHGMVRRVQQERLPVQVKNAYKMQITDRIKLVIRLQASGRFKVMRHCKQVIKALCDAVWDSTKQTDERLDDMTSDIDTLDALEYSIERSYKNLTDYIVRN